MTAQPPLPVNPSGAVPFGAVAALVAGDDGGRVFIRGELCFVWDDGDEAGRRLTAVQLVRIKAASGLDVAAAFGVSVVTLWRWRKQLDASGTAALAWHKRGPKGPSLLSDDMAAEIRARRSGGATLQAVADAVGVSVTTVRRALVAPTTAGPTRQEQDPSQGAVVGLPVLPLAADRDAERAAARWGKLPHAEPLFAPAARVPLAGLLLAIPALEATGLLSCAATVFGSLRNWFYGLDTMLVEGVLRALAGEPRAEGATRIDPAALGRVLGLDRGPEVKTIRRNITALAGTGRAEEPPTSPAWTRVTRTCWRCSTLTGTSAPTKARPRSPRPTCPG
jgi:transposase